MNGSLTSPWIKLLSEQNYPMLIAKLIWHTDVSTLSVEGHWLTQTNEFVDSQPKQLTLANVSPLAVLASVPTSFESIIHVAISTNKKYAVHIAICILVISVKQKL